MNAGRGINVPINGWLFDFDNTLALLEPCVDWARSRRELESFLRSQGVPEELFAEFPVRNLSLYEGLRGRLRGGALDCGLKTTLLNEPALADDLLRRMSEIIESYELIGADIAAPLPGAVELLAALRRAGARLAIVTSNSSRTVRRWLGNHDLGDAPGLIVGRDSGLALKPDPAMVLRALEALGLAASEAVLAGDSDSDLKAAAAAGIRFLGVASCQPMHEQLNHAGALEVFTSPFDLAHRYGIF